MATQPTRGPYRVNHDDPPILRVGETRHAGAYQLIYQDGEPPGYFCDVQAPIRNGDFDEEERERRCALIVRAVNRDHLFEEAANTLNSIAEMPLGSRGAYSKFAESQRLARAFLSKLDQVEVSK